MSIATIGFLVIILLFVFFLLGLEIGFSMALAGFIGFAAIVNVEAAMNLVAKDIFSVLSLLRIHGHCNVRVHGSGGRQRGCGAKSL